MIGNKGCFGLRGASFKVKCDFHSFNCQLTTKTGSRCITLIYIVLHSEDPPNLPLLRSNPIHEQRTIFLAPQGRNNNSRQGNPTRLGDARIA